MYCTQCGKENAEGSTQCAYCGAPLVPSGPPSPRPRTSRMAVASLVLGILSFFLVVPALIGLLLGIVSLVKINRSQGRLRGQGLAIAGICTSGFMLLLVPMLAAMVFPVFVRARESARKAVCLSNVKNMALAINMYATDYDAYPPGDRWCDAISDYVKNQDVFTCPDAPDQDCAFAYNVELDGAPWNDIADPGREIAIFESDAGWNVFGGMELLTPEPRHLGGDNYGYADGHAAWEPRSTPPPEGSLPPRRRR